MYNSWRPDLPQEDGLQRRLHGLGQHWAAFLRFLHQLGRLVAQVGHRAVLTWNERTHLSMQIKRPICLYDLNVVQFSLHKITFNY